MKYDVITLFHEIIESYCTQSITKRGIESYFGNYSYYIKESENRLLLEFKAYKDQQKIIEAMKKETEIDKY